MDINEFLNDIRFRRNQECFIVVNRGKLWYDQLNKTQIDEMKEWYKSWLDITDVINDLLKDHTITEIDVESIIPVKPNWIGVV